MSKATIHGYDEGVYAAAVVAPKVVSPVLNGVCNNRKKYAVDLFVFKVLFGPYVTETSNLNVLITPSDACNLSYSSNVFINGSVTENISTVSDPTSNCNDNLFALVKSAISSESGHDEPSVFLYSKVLISGIC